MFWYNFPGATEEEGNGLLERARALDPFWERFGQPGAEQDMSRLRNRGIFAAYYNVA